MSFLLPRAIGSSRAFEIMLSGRDVSAAEAAQIGLVSRTVPDADLLPTALDLADTINGWSTQGVQLTKRMIWSGLETGSLAAASRAREPHPAVRAHDHEELRRGHARAQGRPQAGVRGSRTEEPLGSCLIPRPEPIASLAFGWKGCHRLTQSDAMSPARECCVGGLVPRSMRREFRATRFLCETSGVCA